MHLTRPHHKKLKLILITILKVLIATTQSETRAVAKPQATAKELLQDINIEIDTIRNPNRGRSAEIPNCLTAKSVEGPPLPLEGVNNVHGSDGLAASVFSVGDSVANDVL